jgi:Glycosyltransferase 61
VDLRRVLCPIAGTGQATGAARSASLFVFVIGAGLTLSLVPFSSDRRSVIGRLSRWFVRKLERTLHDARARWCARFGPPLQIVSDASCIRQKILLRPALQTNWANPLELQFYGDSAQPAIAQNKEVMLYKLDNIWITGSEALMFCGPHTLLRLDSSQIEMTASSPKIRRPISRLAHRIEGQIMQLGGRGTGNRGHFLCEHLPRLLLAREKLGNDYPLKILLTPDNADWQTDYLVHLGEDPRNMVEGSRGTLFCPQAWFVPDLSPGPTMEIYQPDIYREIARRFKRGLSPRGARRSLFITRNDAPTRRLLNEDEIFEACRDVYPDMERIAMSKLSLSEQIALFADAKIVIGALGQPFRSVLWCEGALTIQLSPGPRSPVNPYLQWATYSERLGLIHENRSITLYAGPPSTPHDWVFPLADFRRSLDRLASLQ